MKTDDPEWFLFLQAQGISRTTVVFFDGRILRPSVVVVGDAGGTKQYFLNCRLTDEDFFKADEWHHITFSYGSRLGLAIYIDGRIPEGDALDISGNPNGSDCSPIPVMAGIDNRIWLSSDGNSGGYFRFGGFVITVNNIGGLMDNVRVYSKALDIVEVQKIYAQEKVDFINR